MNQKPILLVEDDPDIQENLRFFLEHEGFQVKSAFNGKEALNYIKNGNPVQVVLLDLMMPVMDGYEFLEKIQQEDPTLSSIPIIVLSAAKNAEQISKVRQLPLIKKPIDLDLLIQTIQKNSACC